MTLLTSESKGSKEKSAQKQSGKVQYSNLDRVPIEVEKKNGEKCFRNSSGILYLYSPKVIAKSYASLFIHKYSQLKPEIWLRPFANTTRE